MPNKVFLNKSGFIEQILSGKQTFQSMMEVGARTMTLGSELQDKNKKIKILTNVRDVKKVTADTLVAGANVLDSVPNSHVAIFGGNKSLYGLANLVILATKRTKNTKLFSKKSQAIEWLKKQ